MKSYQKIADDIAMKGDVLIDMKTSEMYHYKDGVWYSGEVAKNRIYKDVEGRFDPDESKPFNIKSAIDLIKIRACRKIRPSGELCIENGVLDPYTLDLKEHDRELHLIRKIPVVYNRVDYTPWSEFVMELVGTKEFHDTLQEYVGYSHIPGQIAKKFLYTYGDRNSGKSTFFNILASYFGGYNVSTLSLEDITKTFLTHNLRFKMVNIRSDIDYTAKPLHVSLLKSLTGNDAISADKKFSPVVVEFNNDSKIYLSGNGVPSMPKAAIKDNAFCSRWLPVRFPFSFPKSDIADKWTTPEAKTMILCWALDGLKRLKENDWEFTFNPSITWVANWLGSTLEPTGVDSFLFDNYLPSKEAFVPKMDMYNNYVGWCKERGFKAYPSQIFHRFVSQSLYFDVVRYQPKIGDKQVECWKGIREYKGDTSSYI